MQIPAYTYTYLHITPILLFLYCMYAYVSVCMRMYMFLKFVCACILLVLDLYLYVWPRLSLNTLQSLQKAAWRGGTSLAGLSTPLGMGPYHFAGILRPCPWPILAHRLSTHASGGVKAHLCRSEYASCGQMKHVGPAWSPFQGDLGRWCRPTGSDAAAAPRQKPLWTLILQCMYVYVSYVCVCICMYAYVSVCIVCICRYCMY